MLKNIETADSSMSLKVQVDSEGQVLSFTDDNATWKFMTPISIADLVEKYKDMLANVVV